MSQESERDLAGEAIKSRQRARRRVPPALVQHIYSATGRLLLDDVSPARSAELADEIVRAVGQKLLDQDTALRVLLRGARYQIQAAVKDRPVVASMSDHLDEAQRLLAGALDLLPRDLDLLSAEEEPLPPSLSTVERGSRLIDPLGIRNAEVPE